MQAYSNPSRAAEPFTLPDIEVFYVTAKEAATSEIFSEKGWYWWPCLPGCLPDSDPVGPFASEQEALADAALDEE